MGDANMFVQIISIEKDKKLADVFHVVVQDPNDIFAAPIMVSAKTAIDAGNIALKKYLSSCVDNAKIAR
jgi:hypothetical protein